MKKRARSPVFLTSTDTTVGFVSKDAQRLDEIKGERKGKRYITVVPSFEELKKRVRVPSKFRKELRRAARTTYIYPNGESYRVVNGGEHRRLIERLGWAYSTSANRSGEEYEEKFAVAVADIVIYPLKKSHRPSTIYRLGRERKIRLR